MTATRTPAELAQVVKQAIATLDALQKGLEITSPKLSATSKRHTARYRKGGDKVIAIVGNVARHNRVEFPRAPVSEMNDQMKIADAIEALQTRVLQLHAHLGNIVFSARAGAWGTAMEYYALLQRMARKNREIAAALEPVTKFMSVHDPRKKRQVGEPSRPAQRAAKKALKTLERLQPLMVGAVDAPKKK